MVEKSKIELLQITNKKDFEIHTLSRKVSELKQVIRYFKLNGLEDKSSIISDWIEANDENIAPNFS